MISLLFYYVVLPMLGGYYVIKLIKKHGGSTVPPEVTALYAVQPVEKKWYRAARRDQNNRLTVLGDFETQLEAVDRAYLGKEEAQKAGEKASFLVLNDKGEVYQQVDS